MVLKRILKEDSEEYLHVDDLIWYAIPVFTAVIARQICVSRALRSDVTPRVFKKIIFEASAPTSCQNCQSCQSCQNCPELPLSQKCLINPLALGLWTKRRGASALPTIFLIKNTTKDGTRNIGAVNHIEWLCATANWEYLNSEYSGKTGLNLKSA